MPEEKELKTRQFRKQPFCWQEKRILRLLRQRYNKKTLPHRKSVYLSLTEIESDFGSDFIKNYTKTIATYAGVERHLASKILKEFERLGILTIEILRDEKGKFAGKQVYLLECPVAEKPPVGNPPVGSMPHKKVVINKKLINSKKMPNFNFKKEKEKLVAKMTMVTPHERTNIQEEVAARIRPSGIFFKKSN